MTTRKKITIRYVLREKITVQYTIVDRIQDCVIGISPTYEDAKVLIKILNKKKDKKINNLIKESLL